MAEDVIAAQAAEQEADLVALMDGRARTYGLMARLFLKEVDKAALAELQGMRFPAATGNAKVDEGALARTEAVILSESVYTSERRLMMQEARAEVLQTLRENNLKRGSWTEGEDHIALELEFMQRMAMRTADAMRAGDEDAAIEHLRTQRTFAQDHLLNWLPMMTEDMRRFSRTMFYQGLAQLVMGYAEEDAAVLDELLDSVDQAA